VVDSLSDDGTQEIARSYSNAEVVERPFDTLRNQHTFGLQCVSQCRWVLRLDADWMVSDELLEEIARLDPAPDVAGIRVRFRFAIHGRIVPIALYPPVVCLFRPDMAHYVQDGHTERLVPEGQVIDANGFITHDDRKPIDRFLLSQVKYSTDEIQKILNQHPTSSRWSRSHLKYLLRSVPGLSAFAVVCYLGVWRFGFFRGRHARHYILQRAVAELVIALRLIDQQLQSSGNGRSH
jgi:hypothetical protein